MYWRRVKISLRLRSTTISAFAFSTLQYTYDFDAIDLLMSTAHILAGTHEYVQ